MAENDAAQAGEPIDQPARPWTSMEKLVLGLPQSDTTSGPKPTEPIDATAPVPAAQTANFFDKFDGDPKVNYFDQFDKDPDAGDAGLLERFRLHTNHSYYTGTLKGSSELAG